MKKFQSVLLGGAMAFALAACNTTDSASTGASATSGASSMGATQAGSTGNPTIDAQMGISPNDVQTTGPANSNGNASTPTNTGHTTTGSNNGQ